MISGFSNPPARSSSPIAAVAARAGVGISALYRRYDSKQELMRYLCADGLARYIATVEAALADTGDRWAAFVADSCGERWTPRAAR